MGLVVIAGMIVIVDQAIFSRFPVAFVTMLVVDFDILDMMGLATELAHDVGTLVDHTVMAFGAISGLTEAEMVWNRFLVMTVVTTLPGAMAFAETVIMTIGTASS